MRRSIPHLLAAATALAIALPAAGLLGAAPALAQMPGAAFSTQVPPFIGRGSENYVVFDALYMQRNGPSSLDPRTLVLDSNTNAPGIATRNLDFAVAPGYRLLLGTHAPETVGWEVGSLGVYGMFADTVASGADSLQLPPPLGEKVSSLRNARFAGATYGSTLNSAEANAVFTRQYVHLPHFNAYEHDLIGYAITVDWLTGFRWAGLDETAGLSLGGDQASLANVYSTRTSSNLFGWQLGVRGRVDWEQWALEGGLKAALAGATLSQSQGPIVNTLTGETFRDAGSGRSAAVGGIFELGTSLVYRLSEVWGLRFGYSMLWLTGVALAPNQFDFSNSQLPVTGVDGNGTIWLGGGSVGLEARW